MLYLCYFKNTLKERIASDVITDITILFFPNVGVFPLVHYLEMF